MNKRERFLLYLLAGVLAWQAGMFTYGAYICANSQGGLQSCPELGQRYDGFVQATLGAVLGLLAGSSIKE